MLPTATGTCDEANFYIAVKYGNQGKDFQTMLGARDLTTELADGYNFQDNGTHFSLVVPYNAMDTTFEVCVVSGNYHHEPSALYNLLSLSAHYFSISQSQD